MISFDKPINLNGFELREELNAAGVSISNEPTAVKTTADNLIWLDIDDRDKEAAAKVIAAHDGTV